MVIITDSGLHWKSSRTAFTTIETFMNRSESATAKERDKWVGMIIMDRIKTGPNIGMIKTRSKNEVVKPKIPSSTGFSSAKNAKNTSPYKDEN